MTAQKVTNVSGGWRYWGSLKDADTGLGLTLDAGESANAELPDDFDDPNLQVADPAPAPVSPAPPAPPTPSPAPPAAPAPADTEEN